MKNIFKAFLGLTIAATALSSCERDTTLLNVDEKHPSDLTSGVLLSMGQQQEFYQIDNPSVNANNYRFFVQQWSETTYTDEVNYNLITRNQPRFHFQRMYVYALHNFKKAQDALVKEVNDPAVADNKWVTNEISSIFVWENVVDTWGDVPYSEALKALDEGYSPKYDDAKAIYADLLKRIDIAIAKIKPTAKGYELNDIVYKGDMAKWKKLANSVKLRLALNLADIDPVTAKAAAEAAIASGVMTSTADSYSFVHDGVTFTNPVFDNLVASNRDDFVPSNVLVDIMNANNDPRRDVWFTKKDGAYIGGVYGTKNPYANFSHVADSFKKATTPTNLLSYSEVLFMQAEGAARGFNMGGTAAGLYGAAINESMAEYGLDTAKATAYIAAHPYDATNWKKSIGMEAWIAMYNRAFAAWNFVRRLDFPALKNPVNSNTKGVPVRMIYSSDEYNQNEKNVRAAAAKIGGDDVTTKLFWDKN
ncbi:SusD/RagB family nutrient-binding outer membrane lipoprotein [Elizabethkingia anophelis]|uniref:SusD/RagB family nutrient-binding outer membrane lipoprotein n=1 Tax=Elizabethkingia anophelis TaxID=1117645 RepID=UPI0006673116|nr:SusD/RagB family nutrient-binding outer membrane lipoprotein [Elizabethkingia anophelis]AQW90112.1 hypothetical protein BBD28_05325 [Elizabethkingia anophelis]KUY23724.1 hypothetical protein ATB94_13585 [Elizabethkingia anophelis]MCT3719861.1 SusD/RagB family nutrient-binding outer membrane lipoprotein [Elizabethkingia anophelis]MCT3723371.1 SusD/RagB family nutrient-binding outer membrane lipoprotein [Elizabethkingia anophelis]MCT3728335.1 SusD/RagB family nutrient-binding outer membrane l